MPSGTPGKPPGSGFPIQVSRIQAGRVTTSWSTSQPGGRNIYNVAYDIWFNTTPTTSGPPDGADAVHRGYLSSSWYLIDVEAGFELWRGGAGLATKKFSVHVAAGRRLHIEGLVRDSSG